MADEATPRKRRPAKQAAPAAVESSPEPAAEPAPAPAAKPSKAPRGPEAPLLRRKRLEPGDRGPAVLQVQEQLERRGFSPGKLTGTYGYATVRAVRSLQGASGLRPSGIIDAATLAALYQ